MFEEMMKRAKMEAEAYYTTHYAELLDTLNDKVEQLSSYNEQLSSSNEQLSSKVDYLENLRESFKFCVNSKSDIRYVNSFKWAEPIFLGSALVCIIQGFLLLSMYQL